MNFLLALAIFLAFSAVLAYTENERQNFKAAHEKCQSDPDVQVDDAQIRAYVVSQFKGPLPENMGPHTLCISKAVGYQMEDGTVIREHLRKELLETTTDTAKVDKILDDCTADQGDATATAIYMFKCLDIVSKQQQH